MSTEPEPTPIASLLKDTILRGRDFCVKSDLNLAEAIRWVADVRRVLGCIYGKNTAEVDFWCSDSKYEMRSHTPPQNIITSRLFQIESLALFFGVPNNAGKVFIGHGRSLEWLKLKIFLSDNLWLCCDEFNIEPTAGVITPIRIESMLASARMAFLVLTAEDKHVDGSKHARENVIHETGLLQAKLGYKRAIVLLEEGCTRFSNLDGLTTIDFPPGDIMSKSEEIRRSLNREEVLPKV